MVDGGVSLIAKFHISLNYLEWVFKIRRKEENANSLLIGPKIRDISESGFGETMSGTPYVY